jgi:hypothetical protein
MNRWAGTAASTQITERHHYCIGRRTCASYAVIPKRNTTSDTKPRPIESGLCESLWIIRTTVKLNGSRRPQTPVKPTISRGPDDRDTPVVGHGDQGSAKAKTGSEIETARFHRAEMPSLIVRPIRPQQKLFLNPGDPFNRYCRNLVSTPNLSTGFA